MKLRLDLLKYLKPEDTLKEAVATARRFKPEPLFSKTGTGSLSSASTEERANEVARSTALILRLEKRLAESGKGDATKQ